MSAVDDLFERYRAAYRAGEELDPRPYLAEVSGTDRRELAALIDAFLERAPAPAFVAARVRPETSRAVSFAMDQMRSETWQSLLPAAEERLGIARGEIVDRLAGELGVAGKRDKVHLYYHEMEHGLLSPEGVRPRVLEVLAGILELSVERLREAGRRMAPPAAGAAPAVFARSAPAPAPSVAVMADLAEEEPWDEVDDLFKGG
jgi:hypothetical protein